MKDTYRHRGLRRKLVETLRNKGIQDEQVLQAIGTLPRHYFLDKAFEEWAYHDKAFPIGNNQTISQPYTVARQTEILKVQARTSVLEIGTGSGYQAAILGLLKARVYTLERQEALYEHARHLLNQLGFGNIRVYLRDGYNGLPEFAPFDRIIVTAAAPEIPETLLIQLKIGGFMVIPVGSDSQKMMRIKRIGKTEYDYEENGSFRFVPFLKGLKRTKD